MKEITIYLCIVTFFVAIFILRFNLRNLKKDYQAKISLMEEKHQREEEELNRWKSDVEKHLGL